MSASPWPPGFRPKPASAPPRPSPGVQPKPVPAQVIHNDHAPTATGSRGLYVVIAVLALAAGGLGLHALGLKLTTAPPVSDGYKVGRELAPALDGSLANGFDKAASLLDAGKTVGEADAELKATFDAERKAAFAKIGGPFLNRIVPAGEEPTDDAKRKAFAEAHREIAKGLRGSK